MERPTLGELLNSTEAGDLIAKESLKWHLNAICGFCDEFEKEDKGHPDDFVNYVNLKRHFEEVLKYYGN